MIVVVASSKYTLTIVTNNNEEIMLAEKMTEDNACFKPHKDHAIPSIGRQVEVMLLLVLFKSLNIDCIIYNTVGCNHAINKQRNCKEISTTTHLCQ